MTLSMTAEMALTSPRNAVSACGIRNPVLSVGPESAVML